MKRRSFLKALGGLVAAPLAVKATPELVAKAAPDQPAKPPGPADGDMLLNETGRVVGVYRDGRVVQNGPVVLNGGS